jgi:pimeloyl-ACP methyl ester carboxylesterase
MSATLLFGAADAPASVDPAGELPMQVGPCRHDETVTCGVITVPRYWSEPEGPTINVRFRLYPAEDPSLPEQEPLVGFAGGPGSGSIGSVGSWRSFLGDLHDTHPILVMDYRGTGRSEAIDCTELQYGEGDFVDQSEACGEQLGDAAYAYGNAASSADLHAIIEGLGIEQVSLYGTSAGSLAAGSFAANYPDDVRAAILDGAYDDTFDALARDGAAALRSTWRKLCDRSSTCEDVLDSFAQFARELEDDPYTGIGYNGSGIRKRVTLTPELFATMVFDGTFSSTMPRDLPAAVDAFRAGDPDPIMRLAAELVTSNAATGGQARFYSYGYYMAVYCNDNPLAFDRNASFATRERQLQRVIDGLPERTFYPFENDVYLHHQYEYELVFGCLHWPQPRIHVPAFPAGPMPDVPMLVLNGEFDYTTPPANARAVAERFPNATYVEIANGRHVVARGDIRCAIDIARRFLVTLDVGDTSCASQMPNPRVVPEFPRKLEAAPEARIREGDRSTPEQRRAAWGATWTLGEALGRARSEGVGLRGGTYSAGSISGTPMLGITFRNTQFVRDLQVFGEATYDRSELRVEATLRIEGPGGLNGTLQISFRTGVPDAVATISGEIDGRRIRLATSAPWATRV